MGSIAVEVIDDKNCEERVDENGLIHCVKLAETETGTTSVADLKAEEDESNNKNNPNSVGSIGLEKPFLILTYLSSMKT